MAEKCGLGPLQLLRIVIWRFSREPRVAIVLIAKDASYLPHSRGRRYGFDQKAESEDTNLSLSGIKTAPGNLATAPYDKYVRNVG